ncbi:MAG TPA: O-antigen ligase family protein [Ilumatobacteraceae bacterium]|nr:O-antigen ligase family protein [Ilumatobacteraceae bacterium]
MGHRPVGAILSQVVVAVSSLVLALIALQQLGLAGLGTFSLLFGILITVNSIQTGWIGDSLTVLDRFDPGIRRALFQSQWLIVALVAGVTFTLAQWVDGVDGTTALLFAAASVAWVLEETLRRLLIARREFWKLVANDAAFATGALGFLTAAITVDIDVTIETMVLAVLVGSTVAVGVGLIQLPRVELVTGPLERSRFRELAAFAGWRSVQVGLRPGSLAVVRAVVATTASLETLGQLEAARLLIAPVLTVVNGAGVYLLPTYSAQVRARGRLRPSVGSAMLAIGGLAAGFGIVAYVLRDVLAGMFTPDEISAGAVASWVLFSVAFAVGVPAGSATVAHGHSRRTFTIRAVDAAIGVGAAGSLALLGWTAAVPAGLALGAFVGAWLLVRSLRRDQQDAVDDDPMAGSSDRGDEGPSGHDDDVVALDARLEPAHWSWAPHDPSRVPPPPAPPPAPPVPAGRPPTPIRAAVTPPPSRRRIIDWNRELLWLAPLVLIVATEFKIRRRSIDDLLTGSIDPMIAFELATYALIGIWALWRILPDPPRLTTLTVIMWGYMLTTAVSAIYSEFPMLALARAVQLIVIGVVIQLLAGEAGLTTFSRLLHGWIVLLSGSILVGLAYVAPTTGPQEGRFTWLSVHSVSAGSMLALSVPVLFGLMLSATRRRLPWPAWAYGSLFVVHVVFLLLTRTRGSIGGALVAIAVMAWLASGRRMKPELVLGSLVAGGALALAFGRPVLEFLTRGETADQIGTFNRRTEIWSLAWDAFVERPLFGLGFNSAKGVFFDETGLGGAHNAAINVMIDVGVAGLVWWFALIIASLGVLARLRRVDRRSPVLLPGATGTARSDILILIGMFTAMLINSVTTEGLGAAVNVSAIWLFVVAAWLTTLDRELRAVLVARQRDLADERADRDHSAVGP